MSSAQPDVEQLAAAVARHLADVVTSRPPALVDAAAAAELLAVPKDLSR